MAFNHIVPGQEIKITEHIYFSQAHGKIADLVTMAPEALEQMKQASIEREKSIYEKLCASTGEWAEQAEQTLRLMKAIEYLKTPAVQHTSNVWKEDECGNHELSNMVYKLTWRVYEDTKWDRKAERSIPVAWYLSWYLFYNSPHNVDSVGHRSLGGQERKRFSDKAAMGKYLQGRIAAYAHLFTELSPPVPEAQRGCFSVNGQLLPGYTLELEREAVVAGLLDLLGDDDIPAMETAAQGEPPPGEGTITTSKEDTDMAPMKLHTIVRNERRAQKNAKKPGAPKK